MSLSLPYSSLLVYICITVGNPIIKSWRIEIPLTGFIPPHLCACPKPGPGFPASYVVLIFVFNDLR